MTYRDPDRLIGLASKMEAPMERFLKWKQVCDAYDRGKNAKLGQIMSEIRDDKDVPKAVEGLKLWAHATQAYGEYLSDWDAAEKKMIKAKVEYEMLRCNWESYQSAVAWDREAIKRGII